MTNEIECLNECHSRPPDIIASIEPKEIARERNDQGECWFETQAYVRGDEETDRLETSI